MNTWAGNTAGPVERDEKMTKAKIAAKAAYIESRIAETAKHIGRERAEAQVAIYEKAWERDQAFGKPAKKVAKPAAKKQTFAAWMADADMPTQDANGWYDAETGIRFNT